MTATEDPPRSLVASLLAVFVPAVFFARFLSADIGGVVTNDSLGYFSRAADNPFGEGLVVQGYRQVALPLWVWSSDLLASAGGWDRIFGVALLHRTILLVGLGLVWWALRWWAIPALAIFTTPTYIVHADFVLPEGVLIPGSLVAAGLAASVMTERPLTRAHPLLFAAASGALAFLLSTIKLQYTSLLCLTAAVVWTFWREGHLSRRTGLVVLAVPFALSATLALAQSFENQDELGVFEPVSERARAEWYGAWQATFNVDTENRADPAQAEWYDEGNLYTFLKGIESTVPEYSERHELVRDRTHDMFDAAGTSVSRERFRSFLGGLQAGRTDDIAGIVNRALDSHNRDQTGRLTLNWVGREGGVVAVEQTVNEGRPAGFMETSVLFGRFGSLYRDYRPLKATFATVSLIILVGSLLVRGPHRPMALGALGVIVSVSMALGSAYIDNARYLLGPLSVIVVAASVATRSMLLTRPRKVS